MAVVGAVFFTILLVAGNTMAQSVRERTEELGVLKAMGFTNLLVLRLVLLESCAIAMLGGFGGLGVAWLIIAARQSGARACCRCFYLPPRDLGCPGSGAGRRAGLVAAGDLPRRWPSRCACKSPTPCDEGD